MRFPRFLLVAITVVSAMLVSACAPMSPYCSQHIQDQNEHVADLLKIKKEEVVNIDEAIKEYEAWLGAQGGVGQAVQVYQEDLKTELQQLQSNSMYVLSENAILGFPYYYHKKLGAVVRVHLALARLYIKKNDLNNAAANVKDAVDLIHKWGKTSYIITSYLLDAHDLQQQIYQKYGKAGKALLAQLNRDLIEDYLFSEEGVRTYYYERQLYNESIKAKVNIDKFIGEINHKRQRENDAFAQEVMGSVMDMANTMAQVQMQNAMIQSGGKMTPQIQAMQMNQMVMDITVKMAKAGTKTTTGVDVSINPVADINFVHQLIDPKRGVKTFDIITAFTFKAIELSGNEALKQSANDVLSMVDSLKVIRKGGNAGKIVDEVTKFADTFNSFQSQVQQITKK